jgi:uncharacterized protein (TIGR03083 family)
MADEAQQIVDLLESIWQSIADLCSSLRSDEWDLQTDCPGWTVKDQLSHIIGTEWMLAGKPPPAHEVEPKPHVKNPIGEFNELHVDYRRGAAPEKVLEELRSLTAERIESLRSMRPEDFERQTMTPVGPDTYLEFMRIRAFDCWVHEQDIRRAVGRPGNLSGPAAHHAVGRCFMAMPYVVAKKASAPDGTTAVFEVFYPEGSAPATLTELQVSGQPDRAVVGVEGRRGIPVEHPQRDPTVVVRAVVDAYVALCCGRIRSADALESGAIAIGGDQSLGEAIVENLAFMI